MKKLSAIIAALALVISMTQCKKNVETVIPASHGGVHITLTVNNDGRHSVITTQGSHYGEVTFSEDDELYVGNGGQFVGTLYYHNGQFEGKIGVDDEPPYAPIPLTNGENLHFYYTGGYKYFDGMSEDEGHVYLHFNMSDQRSNLPVFSYGNTGNVVYDETATTHDYECMLLNKCALVKFDLSTNTSDDMVIYGMCSEVKFTFENVDDDVFVPTGKRDPITVNSRGTNNYEKWAILLPQAKVDDATVKIGNTMYLDAVDVPAITNNALLTAQVSTATPYVPVFSVGANTRVRFAPGNLQYNVPTNEWRFAEHQYDFCQQDGEEWITTGWVDFFGWGTWSGTSAQWNPMKVSSNGSEYIWNDNEYFQGTLTNNSETGWFTLSDEQWQYIIDHNKYGMATITVNENDVHGIVILPNLSALTIDETHDSWSDNTYTETTWNNSMEAAGAVFLPATGNRIGTDIHDIGDVGIYWSRTPYANENNDHALYFAFMESLLGVFDDFRDPGCNVRLVRVIE